LNLEPETYDIDKLNNHLLQAGGFEFAA